MKPRHRHHVAGPSLCCPWDCCGNQTRVILISAAVQHQHQLRNLHIFVISNCRLLCQQERISINGFVNLKKSNYILVLLFKTYTVDI